MLAKTRPAFALPLRQRAMLLLSILVLAAGPVPLLAPPQTSLAAEVQTITRFDTPERVIVLTFDAGSDRGYAARILDLLADEGIKASFGMTGVWAEQNPDLVRRMVNEGHHLMNHSYNHPSFVELTTAQRTEQLQRTEAAVQAAAGVSMKPYFRPPFGEYNASVLADLLANGYLYNVMWTVDSLGWAGLSASEIEQRVLNAAVPGGIVLMHVGGQSLDAIALPGIIDALRALGYRFASVRDLVEGVTSRYFPQTGYTVEGRFLRYWENYGGLSLFGYPISEPRMETNPNGDTVLTQWFERARFEYHPGSFPERDGVLLGLLGREVTTGRSNERPFRPVVAGGDANCTFYPQTGHRLCFGFRDYWSSRSGLATFGFPISEEFRERNPDTGQFYTVQYFERARFEWHPENAGTPYVVLLGRLGAQALAER